MEQFYVAKSNVCIVLSSILECTIWKYGSRGYRYILLETVHAAQNLCLSATAEGLGTLPLSSFYNNVLATTTGVDTTIEPVLHGMCIGHPVNAH
jgi:SagB-type dehydrogenase family enzyme